MVQYGSIWYNHLLLLVWYSRLLFKHYIAMHCVEMDSMTSHHIIFRSIPLHYITWTHYTHFSHLEYYSQFSYLEHYRHYMHTYMHCTALHCTASHGITSRDITWKYVAYIYPRSIADLPMICQILIPSYLKKQIITGVLPPNICPSCYHPTSVGSNQQTQKERIQSRSSLVKHPFTQADIFLPVELQ